MNKTFALISLGCAKNLVNSEQMLFQLNKAGYSLVASPDGADLAVINTCGFIDDAKSEAIDSILECAELKKNGRLGGIIVAGCLSERYKDSIGSELPEIDALLGVGSFSDIVSAADSVLCGKAFSSFNDKNAPLEEIPRIISTGPAWAYLRIAEGCNNYCAFCAIPYIRGKYRSRRMEDVIAEAEELAAKGIKEIIVIAQDITRYGIDLYQKRCLAELCRELSAIPGVEWIRLHYLYPEAIDDELIDEIASNNKIVKYLDIPIQHINDQILKKMNRHTNSLEIKKLFRKLRDRIPDLVIRTSLIAGLPGEDEQAFEELCCFLREAKIERAGVFPFSPEEGTPAALMEHVDEETARKRADLLMQIQAPIMDEFCESFVGKTIRVLYEYYDEESQYHVGRSYADSPDIDGLVLFSGVCEEGDMVDVLITSVDNGFLIGEQV